MQAQKEAPYNSPFEDEDGRFVVTADIEKLPRKGDRITLRWNDEQSWEDAFIALQILKEIPGSVFVKPKKSPDGIPFYYFPIEMKVCKDLRVAFRDALEVGPALNKWAKGKARTALKLRSLSQAKSAELTVLPHRLPDLYRAIHLGPQGPTMTPQQAAKALRMPASYQAADVAFMAQHGATGTLLNAINANQPGTGKTIETIAAVFEGGWDNGPNLVVAPVTSLNTVWVDHLEVWQDLPVIAAIGDKNRREMAIEDAKVMIYDGTPFWLIINPEMASLRAEFDKCPEHVKGRVTAKTMRECGECEESFISPFPDLHNLHWNTVTLDEFHKMGLGNPATLTARGLSRLRADKKFVLSGTPIGGKVIKVWAILHYLYPDEFASKMRFAHQWMTMRKGWDGNPVPGDELAEGVDEEFWEMLSTHMVRRPKAEVLPWLPPKQPIEIWAEMEGKQAAQYEEFAREAEIRIDDERLSATSVLAEYARLKQFAYSVQRLVKVPDLEFGGEKVIPYPTAESCKLPHILDVLEELGCVPGDGFGGDEQCVIFSQFTKVVDELTQDLRGKGVAAEKITGAVSEKERTRLVREFQSDTGARVLVMNIHAGGVAITLDKASTVIILDETWNPDDQEQAEDRCHRGSRNHQVRIIRILTKGTVEEYIRSVNIGKDEINYSILDLRRMGLRATGVVEEEAEEA